jgi:hypothetical protein
LLARIRAELARTRAREDEHTRQAESVVARALNAQQPGSGYRAAEPPSADELWAIVDDVAVSPELRVRAAAALRRYGEGEPRKRLLRVAEDTADPALAKALRVAAAEDDAGVEAVIAKVEARAEGGPSARS